MPKALDPNISLFDLQIYLVSVEESILYAIHDCGKVDPETKPASQTAHRSHIVPPSRPSTAEPESAKKYMGKQTSSINKYHEESQTIFATPYHDQV